MRGTCRPDAAANKAAEEPVVAEKVEATPAETPVAEKPVATANAGESIPTNVEAKGSGVARWIFLGVSTAVAVTGGILTYIGNKKAKDAAEKGGDMWQLEENRDKAESGQLMRGIGIAVTAVGVVGIGLSFVF